ncbi:hypothetical protein N9T43_00430, partial [Gammaproteobacteria bacterium]|nr:hypothetical protein [Gammaproteobacteria bacterium]
YNYLEDDISFFANLSTDADEIYNLVPKGENYLQEVDEMVLIPVGKKVRFLITANDVIHSWWMPDFAIKQDAIPGFVNTAWTKVDVPGIYRGKCTELCGKNHGFMPIVVKAVEQDEYDQWVSQKKDVAMKLAELTTKEWTTQELVDRGEDVYALNCVACHHKFLQVFWMRELPLQSKLRKGLLSMQFLLLYFHGMWQQLDFSSSYVHTLSKT